MRCTPEIAPKPEQDKGAARAERLEEALESIQRWRNAYPEDIFIPPEPGDTKRAHEALKAIGLTLDMFSAHAMRHVIRTVGEIVDKALED